MTINADITLEQAVQRLAEAKDMCSDVLGYVQADQTDPKLYQMVYDLLHTITGQADVWAREDLARETAEYIANDLMPKTAEFHAFPEVTVRYSDDQRPPTTVEEIKATLLDGHLWISWMDDRVTKAMRAIHGQPTGDAEPLAS